MRRFLAILVALAMFGACTSDPASTTRSPTPDGTTTAGGPDVVPVFSGLQPRSVAAFANFEVIPLLGDETPYTGPVAPATFDDVRRSPYLDSLIASNSDLVNRLLDDGFVVVPGWSKLFQNAYGAGEYDNHALFVTTDSAYHALHLAFSKLLRSTEEKVLLPKLDHLVLGALENAVGFAGESAGTDYAESASRAAQYWEAVATLLGHDVGEIGTLAQQEIALATDATQMTTSPVAGILECNPTVSAAGCVDYSQYRPRGHYTRNAELQRYFRGMSMLGQAGFQASEPESLRLSLLVSRAILTDPELVADWNDIYETTAFMVGLADDYTPAEAQTITDQIVPGNATEPALLSPTDTIVEIGELLLASRSVGINPEGAAVRIMGARVVIDSFVLDQLGWPNVGEEAARRVIVSPLDVAAAFGSGLAFGIQREAQESIYLHYEEQMEALRNLFANRTGANWSGTVYDAWMYALAAKWSAKGVAFPEFMRSEAWTAKDLMTGLASYTELKHDTVLYGKQAFFAEGGGDWVELEPRHWVEPDPVSFQRIAQVARLLDAGLTDRGLLTAEDRDLLTRLITLVDHLATIAQDELAGLPISQADNDWLGMIASEMEALWIVATETDPANAGGFYDDADDALVADIARSTSMFLEIGTGRVDKIFVLVPDDEGRWQIAEGGVYSYYEFWRPEADGRLTDEEWRQMLDDGRVPDRLEPMVIDHPEGVHRIRPAWQEAFLFPGTG